MYHRNIIVLLLGLLVVGCTSKPDTETTQNLALGYFSDSRMSEGIPITKDKIKVLKSFEKEGAPVMTFQVGGMICDMPVLKTEQGWIARGLNCNGEIYTEEEARLERKKQRLEVLKKEAAEINKNPPTQDGVQLDSMVVENERVSLNFTLIDTVSSDYGSPEEKQEQIRVISQSMLDDMCQNSSFLENIKEGMVYVRNIYLSDKSLLMSVVADKEKCLSGVGSKFAPSQSNGNKKINQLLELVSRDQNNRDAWVSLGNEYFDSEQPAKAIDAYEMALSLNPNDSNVLTDLGVMYRRLGSFDKALSAFEKAVMINPKQVQAYFNIGVVCRYDLNDFDKARDAWNKFLSINPVGPAAEQVRKELNSI